MLCVVEVACLLCCALFLCFLLFRYLTELVHLPHLTDRFVFITGCDSGFGRALTLRLLKDGIPVFAACFTEQGEESLQNEAAALPGKLETLALDVTSDVSVEQAQANVSKRLDGRLLWAIVNNAGVFSIYGPDCWLTVDEYYKSLNVNLLGAVRVTQAFVPLLKKSKGRVISMISVSGRLPGLFMAPYATAKYALEGYMDVIRLELREFGVSVHILEPGSFRTTFLCEKAHNERVDSIWNKLTHDVQQEYGHDYKEKFKKLWTDGCRLCSSTNIHYVIDSYVHAITARFPRARYHCGWDAVLLWIPMTFLPTTLQDRLMLFLVSMQPGQPLIPAALRPLDASDT